MQGSSRFRDGSLTWKNKSSYLVGNAHLGCTSDEDIPMNGQKRYKGKESGEP